jgi:hypothetical protein
MERDRDRRISCPCILSVRDRLRWREVPLGALEISDISDGAREIDLADMEDARESSSRDGIEGREGRGGGGRYDGGMGWAKIFWWNDAHKSGWVGRKLLIS